MLPMVALVGRPNTGKSTLFNRLIGKRRAIESSIPGTTRDRIFETIECSGRELLLVDTGGIEHGKTGHIEADVQLQTRLAIEDANLIVFLVDAKQILTADDFHAAELLRKSGKITILVANKCENPALADQSMNLYELGFGKPITASALHGHGLDELESEICRRVEPLYVGLSPMPRKTSSISLVIIGRPNVGKSTLVNSLLQEKKIITSEIPGTTRDSISHRMSYKEHDFTLIDTAGIRRRGKVEKGIEKFSILRGLQSISEADIVIWMIDVSEGITSQDKHIAEYALEQFKGLIIAVNKSDLLENKTAQDAFLRKLQYEIPFLHFAPVVFISALKSKNIYSLLDQALVINHNRYRKIENEDFGLFLKKITQQYLPSKKSKIKLQIISGTQTDVCPPTFVIRVNKTSLLHFTYKRYIENRLREEYGFEGTVLKITYKNRASR